MRPRRSFWGLLVGAVAAVGYANESLAACNGPYSPCFSADNSWVQPFFDSGLASARLGAGQARFSAGLSLGYQRRPLVLVASSADPYGVETAILDDWVAARALFGFRYEHLELGMTWPFSLGGSGTGLAGATTRTQSSTVVGAGAPHLFARVRLAAGAWSWAVTQELVLPVYTEGSFLGSWGVGYSPLVTGQWAPERGWIALSLGARLHRGAHFGPVRFGSAAVLQTSAGVHLSTLIALFAEASALPALAADEHTDPWVSREQRRVPAEVLAGIRFRRDPLNAALGVGTSLPLTVEHTQTGSTRFAGPPGPSLRLELRLESRFE